MSVYEHTELKELVALLNEKRNQFDKMLNENKEFEEVKVLFHEIRELERTLKNMPASLSGSL